MPPRRRPAFLAWQRCESHPGGRPMSLLGRLEDLSLTDIIQIVYLSRRTGVLEIIDDAGRHTVLFRHGLVVNASSPEHPDFVGFLGAAALIPVEKVATIRQMEESGIPGGTAVLEMNLLTKDDLTDAVRQRVARVVGPLLQSKEGEFNFILSDSMTALDIEYEPEQLFKEGGLAPNRLLGTGEGEKLKPLRGLEESLKAGKALLRGAMSEPQTPSLNLGLGQPAGTGQEPEPEPEAPIVLAGTGSADNVVPFPRHASQEIASDFTPIEELPFPEIGDVTPSEPLSLDALPDAPAPPPLPLGESPLPLHAPPVPDERVEKRRAAGQFKVAGGLFEVESPEAAFRNVVLFERNPLVRVAARRAFARHNIRIAQYGSLDDVRSAMTDLFRSNSFFVTFLELTDDESSVRLLQQLKRKNPRLPVVVVDAEADLRRRHDLLRSGADLYLTKPSPARLQPGLAEEELALFADELVLFAERSFAQWEQLTGGGIEAGRKFYEMASKETMDRSFGVLRQLINELSNPNDIGQVASTILRMSAEYVDRGALFVVREGEFIGLGGFGRTGGGQEMEARLMRHRVSREAPSILADVASSGEPHQGKMRKTPANVELIERMGGLLPTEVVVLPIMHAGRTIGILYGDNAENRAPIDSMTGLEIFLSQAGYAFGNAVFASEKSGQF
jgi:CheY-like chemotaxis protein